MSKLFGFKFTSPRFTSARGISAKNTRSIDRINAKDTGAIGPTAAQPGGIKCTILIRHPRPLPPYEKQESIAETRMREVTLPEDYVLGRFRLSEYLIILQQKLDRCKVTFKPEMVKEKFPKTFGTRSLEFIGYHFLLPLPAFWWCVAEEEYIRVVVS
ncbi:hypothetical protein BGX23_011539 [Mortierella sp. AD031]|nr:hypothetical protein BGX23_011539 [Mortierella sp. AD031]